MNIQQLRQSLKMKWLNYYEENHPWLVKMRIWSTYDGLRRPSSGFILATLSVLEPQFDQILSFILELNNDPDKIITALGLNFNPDEELILIKSECSLAVNEIASESIEESQPLPLVVPTTKNAPQSLVKMRSLGKLPANLTHGHKLVPSFIVTTKVTRARLPPLSMLPQGGSLAITTEVPGNTKTMPSLALATRISSHGKPGRLHFGRLPMQTETPPSMILATCIPKKTYPISSTNARSLASWVDEFCQGSEWNQSDGRRLTF
jgi:Family of unknown function (DUF5331)